MTGKDALVASPLWEAVQTVVKENTSGKLTYHYNDYINCQDSLGMGLGVYVCVRALVCVCACLCSSCVCVCVCVCMCV